MTDMSGRYGISSSTIIKTCIPLGIPFEKKGRNYVFYLNDVVAWEAKQKIIPYGKNGRIILPTYYLRLEQLNSSLQEAKLRNDREMINRIKKEIKEYSIDDNRIPTTVLCCIFIVLLMILVMLIPRY